MIQIQTNLNNFSVLKHIKDVFCSKSQLDYNLFIDEKGIVRPLISECPKCKSPISNNGYNSCQNNKVKKFGLKLKKGKVICSNKDCNFNYNIPSSYLDQWLEILFEMLKTIFISLGMKKLTPNKISDFTFEIIGIKVSTEYIRKFLKEFTHKITLPSPQEKPSGVLVHDEQFVKIKGIDLKRISTVDANNANVYYDKLHDNRSEETMKEVCGKLQEIIDDFYAVVIDGHVASKNAYEDKFKKILIQFCLFHFAKNVRDAYEDEVGYGKGRSRLPLQHLIGFFSILNIFFDHDRELIELRKLQNQLDEHIQRVNNMNVSIEKKIVYCKNYNEQYDYKASKYLNRLRKVRRRKKGIKLTLRSEQMAIKLFEKAKMKNVFPSDVEKQLVRLQKNWKNFTHCMRDSKIPPTSNKVEQFYALTLNWIEKNNLQSIEQFYNQQKLYLVKRYKIPLIKEGIFAAFLKTTFVFLLLFGIT